MELRSTKLAEMIYDVAETFCASTRRKAPIDMIELPEFPRFSGGVKVKNVIH